MTVNFEVLSVEQTVCVCVCVCVCVQSRGCHFPMHYIATTVKEVTILTVNVPVGPLLILHVFERVYQGKGVTLIYTLVTTVISDQTVTVVN